MPTSPSIWGALRDAADNGILAVNRQVTRVRLTPAQINAGAALIPAIPGYTIQVLDLAMIAIGAAALGATSVDVLATQNAATVKLLSTAIAALTRSAVVRGGAANATVLADGASFLPNDVSTGITALVGGANLTTVTFIDFILHYSITKA